MVDGLEKEHQKTRMEGGGQGHFHKLYPYCRINREKDDSLFMTK